MNLEWESANNATGYKLYFGKDNPPTDILNGIDVGNVLTYEILEDDLEYSTTYYWKVVPYNAAGDAFECPVWSFTTENEPAPLPKPITTIEEPIHISNNEYKLGVTVSDFVNVGAISLAFNFDSKVISYKDVAINPSIEGAVVDVVNGKFTMNWTLLPDVLEGVTLEDDEILFTINFELLPTAAETTGFVWNIDECQYASPGGEIIYESTFNDLYWSVPSIGVIPNCAMITNPKNGALNVPKIVVLDWIHVDGATGYKLYIGTDNPPTNIENGKDLGYVNGWELALEYETQYYLKLVPYNETGDAINCPVISFVTTGLPPSCSKLISPQDNGVDIPINVTLEWYSVERALGYKLYFGIDVDNLVVIDVGNNTTYTPSTLLYGQVYYWKVVPYNYGDAEECPVRKFVTEEASNENQPPVIKNQKFKCKAYKNFNPVGQVQAYDPDPSQKLTWEIIKGNQMDYFYIESCSGKLMYFKDPNLKLEPNSTSSADGISPEGDLIKNFTIVVRVTDNHPTNPLSADAEMFIQVHFPYTFKIEDLNAKELAKAFQQPIRGTVVTKDDKAVFAKESKEVTFDQTLNAIKQQEKGEYKMSVIINDGQTIFIKIKN